MCILPEEVLHGPVLTALDLHEGLFLGPVLTVLDLREALLHGPDLSQDAASQD